ncbi:hypothetical protein JAAARDRAFT_203155 [Jaapia argillacea MUCL 33604]|uniref:DUF7726 domain-containing protein n=1 Tax=Jaapia argillacea MUCL 33604 TaxID=933084 RepID=A0A067QM94_9AGAM|nr:hypothetical protein JAAARDRAFT_203155 [Jaapia argillacea MUCL 33604]
MAPKRKSDAIEDLPEIAVLNDSSTSNQPSGSKATLDSLIKAPAAKKARVADEEDASTSKSKAGKKGKTTAPTRWQDVVLEGEDQGEVSVYDDCNDIRRKIRVLQKTPDWKVTHWLRDIGGVNSNSYGRFMKATGPTGGAENGTYYSADVLYISARHVLY